MTTTLQSAPMTIVEGPDGAGKTTLVKAWHRWLESNGNLSSIVHHGPYLNETAIMGMYLRPMVTNPHMLLMDRSWLSEPIYAAAMRHGINRIPSWQRRMLERVALGRSAVVVLCLRGYDELVISYSARHAQEYITGEPRLRQIFNAYLNPEQPSGSAHKLFATQLPLITVNPTRYQPDKIWQRVEARRPAQNLGPGIGHWSPGKSVLLVGDRVSPRGQEGLPFVSSFAAGCSAWLAAQLDAAAVSERQLYWINAHTQDGASTNPRFLEYLRPAAIIALGREAYQWVERYGVTCHQPPSFIVPHPQFWKRFKHQQRYPLHDVFDELRRTGILSTTLEVSFHGKHVVNEQTN